MGSPPQGEAGLLNTSKMGNRAHENAPGQNFHPRKIVNPHLPLCTGCSSRVTAESQQRRSKGRRTSHAVSPPPGHRLFSQPSHLLHLHGRRRRNHQQPQPSNHCLLFALFMFPSRCSHGSQSGRPPPAVRHHHSTNCAPPRRVWRPPPHLYDDSHSCLSMSAAVALSEGSNRSIGRIKLAHSSASSLGNPYLSTSTSEMPQ